MWVERRLQFDPDFPKPIKIGRLRFWDLDALEAYEQSRVAEMM
jgi:predicted DNA-binding transcriptional regulator AlpA